MNKTLSYIIRPKVQILKHPSGQDRISCPVCCFRYFSKQNEKVERILQMIRGEGKWAGDSAVVQKILQKKSRLQRILAQVDLFSLKWITCFWQTALTSKPSIWQICLHSKVELSLTTGWKIKPKKLTLSWLKVNFLGLNFQPVVRLSSTFECGQICQIDGLFAKAVCRKQVIHLSAKRSSRARILCNFYDIL